MSTTRFTPNAFQYNGRVALALLPCLATSAVVGGPMVIACLSVGSMVVYLMDALQYRDGAFTCSWAMLVAANVAFFYSLLTTSDAPVLLQLGLLFANLLLTVLAGMWASLQFRWMQIQYPAVALVFERYVLTGSLPMASIMHSLGLALFVEFSDIPYYLAVILAGLYYALGLPLRSSFYNVKASGPAMGGGKALGQESIVQSRIDGAVLAMLTASAPALSYAAIHLLPLLSGHALHVYGLLLLASGMPLTVSALPQGLWWLPGRPGIVRGLKRLIITVCLLAALVGFEGRVVFHSFGQFIKLPPPWDWAAVTFALFGSAGVLLLHLNGTLGKSVDITVAGSLLLLCTTAGALAAGVPFQWLPAPLVAACGLALFYESRSLREYLVFVVGAFVTGAWFIWHNYWFLDISVGGARLHTLVKAALAALLPALMVPGLVLAKASPSAIGGLLTVQAGLLAVVEERLFVAGHVDEDDDVMYPGYLVIATSAFGIIAARRLASSGHLPAMASWLLHALHGAKLGMLLVPEAALALPCTLLLAAALAPYFLYGPSALNNARPAGSASSSVAGPRARRVRLAPWQGLAHLLAVILAVGLARFAVFDVVQFLVSARPSEGLLVGALLLSAALACLPLAVHCYAANQAVSRAVAGCGLLGLMIALLAPPLPLAGGARCPRLPLALCPRLWDERHVPMHSAEDVEVWGLGLGRREHWPRWLLVAAVAAGMAAAAGGSRGAGTDTSFSSCGLPQGSVAGRLLFSLCAGLLVGGYISLELLPNQLVLQVLVTLATVLVVAFVVILQLPLGGGPVVLPLVSVAWAVCCSLALLLHAELPVSGLGQLEERLFPDSKQQVEDAIYTATKASLLAVVASHALLKAFALKLKAGSVLRATDAVARAPAGGAGSSSYPGPASLGRMPVSNMFCSVVPSAVFARFGAMLQLEGAEAAALQRLTAVGLGWVPTLGNLLTLTAAVLGLALNMFLTSGSPEAVFMLAPLLLLLSADPLLLPGLAERKRYFPPAAAISSYLLVQCMGQVIGMSVAGLTVAEDAEWLNLLRYAVLLLLALPCHAWSLRYLWTFKPQSMALLLLSVPMALLAPLLGWDLPALQYFGASGAVLAMILFFSMKHVKHVGMKVI